MEKCTGNFNVEKNEAHEPSEIIYGWVCPKCGRVFSPFTSMCPFCSNTDYGKITCKVQNDDNDQWGSVFQKLGQYSKYGPDASFKN